MTELKMRLNTGNRSTLATDGLTCVHHILYCDFAADKGGNSTSKTTVRRALTWRRRIPFIEKLIADYN